MKKIIFIFLITSLSNLIFSQVSINSRSNGLFFAKSFSKEISLYRAKKFVMNDIIGTSNEVVRFEIDPLASANSGELTSLVYFCEEKQKSGLILGFYGDFWNPEGVVYQGYGYKNIEKEKAIDLLNKIDSIGEKNFDYLSLDKDNNNIYFSYDDLTFLIYKTGNGGAYGYLGYMGSLQLTIRVFWNGFDSEWNPTAFKRTKERLLLNFTKKK